MIHKVLLFSVGCISLVALVVGVINFYQTPRIAYARSYDLIDKYDGMKEARMTFEAKKSAWQSNIDSLTQGLQNAIGKFNTESHSLSPAQKNELQQFLAGKEQELIHYTKAVEEKAQEEDKQMMQAVLNQVNSYVEEYGQKNGYDVILGTSVSGSVLFAGKSLDVTEEILKGLNESYHGKQ
jgi:outer membrane protein